MRFVSLLKRFPVWRFSTLAATRGAALLIVVAVAGSAFARNLVFVDNARGVAGRGDGTYERPFATLAEAEAATIPEDVIYLANGGAAYKGSITLKVGQTLIGDAVPLDLVRASLLRPHGAPPFARLTEAGPTIAGSVSLSGNNLVAGCTITADAGTAVDAITPQGTIELQNVRLSLSRDASGIVIENSPEVVIRGGGIEATTVGNGVAISGGTGNVRFEDFPLSGTYGTVVSVADRIRGRVVFDETSALTITAASHDAISIRNCRFPVQFHGPVHIVTHGGRGVAVSNARISIAAADSWIEAHDAGAIDVRDSTMGMIFDHVSADAIAPGTMAAGISLENAKGKFEVGPQGGKPGSGGVIRGAQAFGIRIVGAAGVQLRQMKIADSGTVSGRCVEAADREADPRCRAALYLRDVSGAAIDGMEVTGGSGPAVSVMKAADVTFTALRIAGAANASEPAVLLRDAGGSVLFDRCALEGSAAVEQRAGNGTVTFEKCSLSGETSGIQALDDSAALSLIVRHSQIGGAGVAIHASGAATACVDIDENSVAIGKSASAIRIVAGSPETKVRVVGPAAADPDAISRYLALRNGGARSTLQSASGFEVGGAACR